MEEKMVLKMASVTILCAALLMLVNTWRKHKKKDMEEAKAF